MEIPQPPRLRQGSGNRIEPPPQDFMSQELELNIGYATEQLTTPLTPTSVTQVQPTDEIRSRNSSQQSNNEHQLHVVTTEIEQTNADLQEKEKVLNLRKFEINERKAAAKEDCCYMFDDLEEILAKKKEEMLKRIDEQFGNVEINITDCLDTVDVTKFVISEALSAKDGVDSITVNGATALQEDIKPNLLKVKNLYEKVQVPKFVLNFDTLDIVRDLNIGDTIKTGSNEVGQLTDTLSRHVIDQESGFSASAEGGINSLPELPDARIDSEIESEQEVFDTIPETTKIATVSTTVMLPSAPPLPQTVVEGPEEEASPPPYWQACGLSGPESETNPQQAPTIPSYSDLDIDPNSRFFDPNLPGQGPFANGNKLELWHSFPTRKQVDARQPLICGISWNHGKICIADRPNKKVKFISQSGRLLTEMVFPGGEIYDICFLEAGNGEVRYILTVPNVNALLIIAIKVIHNTTHLVRKLVTRRHYTSVCRGPKEQTLVGADAIPTDGTPIVEIFDFTGQVLWAFTHTPLLTPFVYPKSIEVIQDKIFIADWTLNLVCAFLGNGTKVGQYSGTPSSPLLKPLDLTRDQFGNIMIVDGELGNIHVIDGQCNPIEVLKVPKQGSERSMAKQIAFDLDSKALVTTKKNGDIAIFSFRGGYKRVRPRIGSGNQAIGAPMSPHMPETLPLVEGMLPSTIESIGRPRIRHHFNL